jgi:ubiquinone/menaquinone biosynthesis C-methylase UbiE
MSFDRLAPVYDLLLLVFCGAVPRSQRALLSELDDCERALIVGGGTGRFLVDLVRSDKVRQIVCIDVSTAMLERSRRRLISCCPEAVDRCEFRHSDVREFEDQPFDLVCTHCLLDCFNDAELIKVMRKLHGLLAADGRWMFSDFSAPTQQPMRLIGNVVVTVLYVFFRVTCGIKARRLPDFSAEFANLGLSPAAEETFMGGLLVARLYARGRIHHEGVEDHEGAWR